MIVGLGNPGARHAADRHNVGFWFVDELASGAGERFRAEAKLSAEACQLQLGGKAVRLVRPGTFMNKSGQAVRRLMDYYQVPAPDILIVHDELDLPPGSARIKRGGGHGGHNGLRDVIANCGPDFARLRIGIGHPGHKDLVTDYVLHAPSRDERAAIDEALLEGARALELWYSKGEQRAVHYLHSATPRAAAEPDLGPAG